MYLILKFDCTIKNVGGHNEEIKLEGLCENREFKVIKNDQSKCTMM